MYFPVPPRPEPPAETAPPVRPQRRAVRGPHPRAVLLTAAVLYPIVSFALLRLTCGTTGIPEEEHLVFFAYVFPTVVTGWTFGAKLTGAQLPWGEVAAFVCWVAIIGFAQWWFITSIWAII